MRRQGIGSTAHVLGLLFLASGLTLCSCTAFKKQLSGQLNRWEMLGQNALANPILAVGGDGIVFVPSQESQLLSLKQLATAAPATLVDYYAPIFVQQRIDTQALKYPYPPEYDLIGEAHLRHDADGKLTSYVAGAPKVYAIFKKLSIGGHQHVQLTYTAWYPAHPRMKAIDLDEANVDSCVVRITLDADNAPLFYETIAACGCFHKIFVARWIEDAARHTFGLPQYKKIFSVERVVDDAIGWEVAGLVNQSRDHPRRPVVFLKAGDHKVIGLGSASLLSVPPETEAHSYELISYADLYTVNIDDSSERAAFFDMKNGGKVRGAERKKEKFFLSLVGVDSAGQPRADDQIKMHFDESIWGDPTIYGKYLRLPPGTL